MAAGSDVRKTAMYSAVYKVLGCAADLHAGNDVVHPPIVLSWQGISLTSLPTGNHQQERIV